jgi:hypothetical protein
VDAFRVVVDPDQGVMSDQSLDRGRDCSPNDVRYGRVCGELLDGHLRRLRRSWSECADDLWCRVRRAGARLAESRDQGLEQRVVRDVRDLDLELTKTRDDPPTVKDGDVVVDDVGDDLSVIRAERGLTANGPESDLRTQRRSAEESTDEIDRFGRGPAGVAGEHELCADERRPVASLRQLDRPAVVAAVAQADTPAREAKVVRVEVRGSHLQFSVCVRV